MATRNNRSDGGTQVIGEIYTGNRLIYSNGKRKPAITNLQAGSYKVVNTLKLADGTTCYVTNQSSASNGDAPLIIPEPFVDSVKLYPVTVDVSRGDASRPAEAQLSANLDSATCLRHMEAGVQEKIQRAIRVLRVDLANGHDLGKAIANISRIMKLTRRECVVFRSLARRVMASWNYISRG